MLWQIVLDPISSVLMETLDESVFEEIDKKEKIDLDYDLPKFNPVVIQSESKDKTKEKRNFKTKKTKFAIKESR